LSALRALIDTSAGLLVVEGPAGIGKTRLLAEARREAAAAGVRVRAHERLDVVPLGGQHLSRLLDAPSRVISTTPKRRCARRSSCTRGDTQAEGGQEIICFRSAAQRERGDLAAARRVLEGHRTPG
jgi:hypothetical protein